MKDGMVKLRRKLKLPIITPIVLFTLGVIWLWWHYQINYSDVVVSASDEAMVRSFQDSVYRVVLGSFPSYVLVAVATIGLYLTYQSIQSSKSSSRKQLTIQLVTELNENKRLQNTKNLIFVKGNDLPQYYSQLDNHEYKNKSDEEISKEIRYKEDFTIFKHIKINKNFLKNEKKRRIDVEEEKKKRYKRILEDEKLKDDIHYVLNYYEHIALGIRVKAFEEEIFKNLHYSSFMKLWKFAHPLIIRIRAISGKKTIYQEIEYLARRWDNEPIKMHSLSIQIINDEKIN
jgi:hypothetical protein